MHLGKYTLTTSIPFSNSRQSFPRVLSITPATELNSLSDIMDRIDSNILSLFGNACWRTSFWYVWSNGKHSLFGPFHALLILFAVVIGPQCCRLRTLSHDDQHLQNILAVHARTGSTWWIIDGIDNGTSYGSNRSLLQQETRCSHGPRHLRIISWRGHVSSHVRKDAL